MDLEHPDVTAAIARQLSANLSTREQGARFAAHRSAVMRLICEGVERGSQERLCVLGAGNCNDLELSRLLEHFDEVHLVDLDPTSLRAAVARQLTESTPRVVVHAPVDLSGALDKLSRWRAGQVDAAELIRHPRAVTGAIGERLGKRFDRVLSPCVWTQLHLEVLTMLGPEHPLLDALLYTVSLTHLRLLAELLAPAGHAWLVTELTSNLTAELPEAQADVDWLELVARLSAQGNTIAVAHPERIRALLADDPVLRGALRSDGPCAAWRWDQGAERSYLTYASKLSRRHT